MTLRDYVKEKYPNKVDYRFIGGIFGCPKNYPELKHMSDLCGGNGGYEYCSSCWDREFEEKEPERKVEVDVNDVIIAVATLCMKKEEREKTLNTFKVFEKYGVKPMDAIKLMDELREVMK